MTQTYPYGAWPSPLSAATLAAGATRFSDPRIDGSDVYWIEGRPAEGGRQAIVRWRAGQVSDVTPADFNARTRVHEYGGGSFQVADGAVYASRWEDQRLYRIAPDGSDAQPLTPEPAEPASVRFADMDVSTDRQWLVCVRETHHPDRVDNEIVAVPAGGGEPTCLFSSSDFVAAPRLSTDGSRVAWLSWDHPQMPWDGTRLHLADFSPEGLANEIIVAGGPEESVLDPSWVPNGDLFFTTDRSGYWNLHRFDGVREHAVTDMAADIGQPLWLFDLTSVAALDDGRVAAVVTEDAVSRLVVVDPATTQHHDLAQPLTDILSVAASGGAVVVVGGSQDLEAAVVRVPLDGGAYEILARVDSPGLTEGYAPRAEPISYPTPDGATAHAFLYRPRNPDVTPPDGERPPLLVFTHGGPTSHVAPRLSPSIAYWTSRGFAVVDINYRGSTGYGRAYREALKGNWGAHDVADAMAAANHLAERGEVDPDRMAIRGGSAGGFTTLNSLVDPDNPFAAGGSHYGIADLRALAEHTHKFESRYLDSMVGPYPEATDLYRERSPITHAGRLRTPLIVLQGDQDEVVPPAQSEAIVAAAREAGVPHAYLLFEGEQHGFRRAENIARGLEAELAFYGEIMGFEPADDIPPVDIVRPDSGAGA